MDHIIDKRTRTLRDLRISVTDRCNFRCRYCMPKEIFGADYPFLEREEILSFEEITRLAGIFSEFGVEKIRFTGGEPLLRRNLPELIESLFKVTDIKDIALTTNGVFLPKYAKTLKQAGLTRVNVSLDSLDDEVFMKINDVGRRVKPVLEGIRAAKQEGLEVKVNMVVKKGLSDNEIMPMVHYFKQEGITLRFIEFMDVGTTNGWNYKDVISKKEIHDLINSHYPLEPVEPGYDGEVAKRYRYSGTDTEVGFISSVTESFCTSCNRARISTDGKLFTCLFAESGFDLKAMMRGNASDDELKEAIRSVWEKRDDRYSEIRTEESQASRKIEMSYIGG
ncbi:GTP 3',8-cyclase MoaA [Rossellomorea vietnamensis]|uniref:GTP 3',8-cyclase n=1 Tax=Rossellomorea vietnamensis TaxID=218284 RepID=A0A0P6W1A2_9BACI|nr:GTP 3',8-cyclase MoaA [Rossellomorea vietnamensis]KPL59167.1 molybdenum cofactor biosynthesis protein A [Rossellomorea vietnamensis]